MYGITNFVVLSKDIVGPPWHSNRKESFVNYDGSLFHLARDQHLHPHRADGLGWTFGRVHPSSPLVRAPPRLPRTPYTLLWHNNSYNSHGPGLYILPLEAETPSEGLGDEGEQDGRLLGSQQVIFFKKNEIQFLS